MFSATNIWWLGTTTELSQSGILTLRKWRFTSSASNATKFTSFSFSFESPQHCANDSCYTFPKHLIAIQVQYDFQIGNSNYQYQHFHQVSKQLFGIVTGVKCLHQEQCIVTTHAGCTILQRAKSFYCITSGKAFDMGVVSIRKMVSPSELTVVWSVYQVFYIHVYIYWFSFSLYIMSFTSIYWYIYWFSFSQYVRFFPSTSPSSKSYTYVHMC